LNLATLPEAADILRNGGVIAYPTESCYGLGCDPRNHSAVRRILNIKRRNKRKGLILIADRWEKFHRFLVPAPQECIDEVFDSWPGPYTWLLPAKPGVSRWIRGDHDSIAVRITNHFYARALCRAVGMAIVSTSANRSRRSILRSAIGVHSAFGDEIDCIMEGSVGFARSPTTIRDGATGEFVRN